MEKLPNIVLCSSQRHQQYRIFNYFLPSTIAACAEGYIGRTFIRFSFTNYSIPVPLETGMTYQMPKLQLCLHLKSL